jgi:L-alanine-DL-glutamate epimerase-like enolase superfamily enzyme
VQPVTPETVATLTLDPTRGKTVKITKVEVFPIGMPYAKPYEQATGVTKMARRVIVKLYTDEGVVGLGEASTLLPNRTGESAQVIAVVISNLFAPLLIGENPLSIQHVMQKLRRASMDKYGFLYSKTAIDMALHDIAGKVYNVPVAALLGGVVRTSIGVSRSVPLAAPAEVAKAAEKLVKTGYKMITVKAGLDPAADLQRVRAVRKAVGEGFPIEIDANQGYRADVAVRWLSKMEEYDIENVEQPCPWWDLAGMAEVSRALRCTVTADESVLCPAEAMNFVRSQAADAFTIKVAKCGGFLQAKRIAAIADAAGLSCNMGSEHPAGIGTAAMAHFWASTPEIIDSIGYGSPLERFADDIVKDPIEFKNGVVNFPAGIGLGVELDEKKLRKHAIKITVP